MVARTNRHGLGNQSKMSALGIIPFASAKKSLEYHPQSIHGTMHYSGPYTPEA